MTGIEPPYSAWEVDSTRLLPSAGGYRVRLERLRSGVRPVMVRPRSFGAVYCHLSRPSGEFQLSCDTHVTRSTHQTHFPQTAERAPATAATVPGRGST